MITRSGVARDVLIVSCAASAGIHGALTPEHFDEGAGAGAGFLVATLGLAALTVVLTLRPPSRAALAGSVALLGGLLVAYGLAISTGLPVLHPEPEPVDALALVTKAIEAVGLLAALDLLRLTRSAVVFSFPPPKGILS